MVEKRNSNTYKNGDISAIGRNSAQFVFRDFVTKSGGYLVKSTGGSLINWTVKENATMAADNTTVAKAKVVYEPVKQGTTFDVDTIGEKITFAWALIADNVINLKVNGVAMTPVTYAVSNDNTLDLIAAQIQTDFPKVYSAVRKTTRIIDVLPYGLNSTVAITNIVVTLGTSQTTGAAALQTIAKADEGKYYDIASITQHANLLTASASSGQLRLVKFLNSSKGRFTIANT